MKKILFILPLLASASWASATYYSSNQTLPEYEKLIAQMNEQIDSIYPLEFKSEEYHSGFMNSYAVTSLTFKMQGTEEVWFRLKHDISHSPVVIDEAGVRVGTSEIITTLMTDLITAEEALQVIASFEGSTPFVITTRVGVTGSTTNEIIINKAEISPEGKDDTIKFSGANFLIESDDNKRFIGTGSIGDIETSINGSLLSMAASTMNFDLSEIAENVFVGKQTVNFPQFSYTSNGMPFLALEGITIESGGEQINEELMSANLAIAVNKIDSMMLPLESAQLSVVLENINIAGLEKHLQLVKNSPFGQDLLEKTAQEPRIFETYVDDLLKSYKKLLTKDIGMSVELKLTNAGGKADSTLKYKLGEELEGMETLRDLAKALEGELSVNADEEAIKLFPLAEMMMLTQGAEFFNLEDGQYTSKAIVKNLTLELNGNTTSFDSPDLDTPIF